MKPTSFGRRWEPKALVPVEYETEPVCDLRDQEYDFIVRVTVFGKEHNNSWWVWRTVFLQKGKGSSVFTSGENDA